MRTTLLIVAFWLAVFAVCLAGCGGSADPIAQEQVDPRHNAQNDQCGCVNNDTDPNPIYCQIHHLCGG